VNVRLLRLEVCHRQDILAILCLPGCTCGGLVIEGTDLHCTPYSPSSVETLSELIGLFRHAAIGRGLAAVLAMVANRVGEIGQELVDGMCVGG
jgi:hypothetical protein